ncbi:protein of unknown function DUF485 [Caldalkalibacillus thermarum TA2.A1]|uniref:DUF485 domain-containing protein n=1 Tax=Caldalkalibacillus thermarum (strain TA2.A1) TaxID=986075 RepID=F5L684_CALTT|nr:DUF485 domain-containing protein [Caldalkalibacillus thermarum]EGL83134.1 protein of unknown function DUF485 [Caldalkalibacillus thermarum TA2.A1]QZT34833.1 DUF485 domain-containing protein [Caldalkalibacillus thermarum TA2.A1]
MMERKKRWQVTLTLFFFLYFISLPLLIILAPSVMSVTVMGPLSLAWVMALSQFAMIGGVSIFYYYLMKKLESEGEQP